MVIIIKVVILNEVVVLLVDTVISQMNKLVVFVNFGCVLLTGESSQALLVNMNSKRVKGCHSHVYPQVKFVTIDEKWV